MIKHILSRTGYGSFVLHLLFIWFIFLHMAYLFLIRFICSSFDSFVLHFGVHSFGVHLVHLFIWLICYSFG